MYLAGSLGNHVRHTQLGDQHCGQDADVHLLTDADGDGAAVLHPGLLQRGLGQLVNDKGIVRPAAHGLDLGLVLVNGNDLLARIGQRFDQRRAKAAQPDDAVAFRRILLFIKHCKHPYPIVMASSVNRALGSGRSIQRESSVTAPTRPMNIVKISTQRLAAQSPAVMPVESPAVL